MDSATIFSHLVLMLLVALPTRARSAEPSAQLISGVTTSLPQEGEVATAVGPMSPDFPGVWEDWSVAKPISRATSEDSICSKAHESIKYIPRPPFEYPVSGENIQFFKIEGMGRIELATKPQQINFPGAQALVQYIYTATESGGLNLIACFRAPRDDDRYVRIGSIESEGGEIPLIVDAFVANADNDANGEFVLLVRWRAETVLGTSGYIYKPYFHDSHAVNGILPRIDVLDQRVSNGLNGSLEGKKVTYPFVDEESIRGELEQMGF